jgi:uracil-DNA glycosylase family 4
MQHSLFDDRPIYNSFEDIVETMMNMEDDPLFSAGSNMVIYRGNPQARLMIIGEAPGTEEDRLGKPFVGRSGKLLDQILEAVNFDPEIDVFITNAVFRLPPGVGGKPLRKPTRDEIKFYQPYLLEIIRIVDPVIILLTGNAALESILGQTGITRLRGQWQEWQGRQVMPVFHPAYLLRNPSRTPGSPKDLTWKDIQEVRHQFDLLVAG